MPGDVNSGRAYPDTNVYPAWEYLVLRAIGNSNPNHAQLEALNVVAANEGLPDAAHNWLAITESQPNEWGPTGTAKGVKAVAPGLWNPEGVVTYTTQSQGVQAIAEFIQSGHPDLVKALTDPNASYDQIANAFVKNGWPGDAAALAAAPSTFGRVVYTGGANEALGPPKSTGGFTQCNEGGSLISWPGFLGGGNIFSECEAKAIVGGFLVMTGVLLLGGGIALIIRNADDRFGLKDLASAINKPAAAANSGLSKLFNAGAERRNPSDQSVASNYQAPTPTTKSMSTPSTRYVQTTYQPPQVQTARRSTPTPPPPPTRIPRKQKNNKGPRRT